MTLNSIIDILRLKKNFLLVTHKDPDADGIGSMLALGKALLNEKKNVVFLTPEPIPSPLNLLSGCGKIVHEIDSDILFDALIVLDCGDEGRIGTPKKFVEHHALVINIDHHESHDLFGDINFVDPHSSSTGELVFRVIKAANLPFDPDVAENIFAAIQSDTGSFRYDNTTAESLKIAAEMMDYGVIPRRISDKLFNGYTLSKIKLLEIALGKVEFYDDGRIGMIVLSSEMFKNAQAHPEDGERFVDYLRFVSGLELAVIVRETATNTYKFSMRSNNKVNVAALASMFGGGGHAKAAGFESYESIETLKDRFLKQAGKLLSAASN